MQRIKGWDGSEGHTYLLGDGRRRSALFTCRHTKISTAFDGPLLRDILGPAIVSSQYVLIFSFYDMEAR